MAIASKTKSEIPALKRFKKIAKISEKAGFIIKQFSEKRFSELSNTNTNSISKGKSLKYSSRREIFAST